MPGYGKYTLEFDWKYDGPGLGKGGAGSLKVDGKVVDNHPMPRSLPVTLPWVETFGVGIATGTPVDDNDDQVPFRFHRQDRPADGATRAGRDVTRRQDGLAPVV
jgi:hypothetical protein